jgi:pimeloyl-ACP methyl ester carboxylesterase
MTNLQVFWLFLSGLVMALTKGKSESIVWNNCGELKCATIKVPLNHFDQYSQLTEINLSTYSAKPLSAKKTIILLPAEQFASGIILLKEYKTILTSVFGENYDFIGFDGRSFGSELVSQEINGYHTATSLFGVNYVPKGAIEETIYLYDYILKNTAYTSNQKVDYLSTSQLVWDLEKLRTFLGFDKLNLWGVQYGAVVASFYANLFPDKVGRFILDSPFDPIKYFQSPLEYYNS